MRFSDLMYYTDIVAAEGEQSRQILDITYDSRQVRPGSLFAAIPGLKTDGHRFIAAALERGAAAVVIQDAGYQSADYSWILVSDTRKAMADLSNALHGYPSASLNVIGVTGTNGKTTTTNLITTILEDAGHLTGLIGTIHNRIGQEIIPVQHTTPEAPDLQRCLKLFFERKAEYAVMEVSSHALELYRVRGTEFDIAVFTNLTQDHLDFHATMEQYLAAKAKLFSGLSKQAKKQRRKFAIINNDDPYGRELIEMVSVPVITYGIKETADVKADDVKVTAQGVEFILKYTNQEIPIKLKLAGIFNVYNALAAIAVGLVEGIPIEKIIASLERINGVNGRFERVDVGQDFTVIVDYSHTPDGLLNCLKTAREFIKGRIITVFGCGGDRDREKRPIMGEVAARYSDYCYVTSDNPRTEKPEDIINEILPGVAKLKNIDSYRAILDRREAITAAIIAAKAGDAVIIAGKGHENYQIIGTTEIPFDDREIARAALGMRG